MSITLSQPQLTIKKQALILCYNENQQIDQIRRKCHPKKSAWTNLPFEHLHIKLDKLQRNFLLQQQSQDQTQNICISELPQEYGKLSRKINQQNQIHCELKNKIYGFLDMYNEVRNNNVGKGEYIGELRKKLGKLKKNREKLGKSMAEECRNQVRVEGELLDMQKYMGRIEKQYHLMF